MGVYQLGENFRDLEALKPSDEAVSNRLTSPAVATMLNTDNIAFARHKTMWGWGGDKTETINGFECKVYTASGVEILTKTRVEHLNAEDKQAAQNTNETFAATGFQTLLGIEEESFLTNQEISLGTGAIKLIGGSTAKIQGTATRFHGNPVSGNQPCRRPPTSSVWTEQTSELKCQD
ncbi:PREDICTED: ankyrin repeat domain-containing protein 13D-like [Acropora digitifera]|uniref:ankyrin repeat domain-containing protein 13D-like n=1 Tax=Acropora digitifera TaxID=70779 RepID=UPI00077ACAE9|nr:PREDICTED: ankyrin repeat domain-containing protein 13D-like [Acropora digitifera]